MTYEKELKKVAKHLQGALSVLAALRSHAEGTKNFGMQGSVGYLEKQINEILSTDGGEAGLQALIAALSEKQTVVVGFHSNRGYLSFRLVPWSTGKFFNIFDQDGEHLGQAPTVAKAKAFLKSQIKAGVL